MGFYLEKPASLFMFMWFDPMTFSIDFQGSRKVHFHTLTDSHLSVAAAVSSSVGNYVAGHMDFHNPRLLTSMMVAWLFGFLHSFPCHTNGCKLQLNEFLHNSSIWELCSWVLLKTVVKVPIWRKIWIPNFGSTRNAQKLNRDEPPNLPGTLYKELN